MSEQTVKTINSADGKRRVFIVRRNDGLFMFLEEERVLDRSGDTCWSPTRANPSGFFDKEQLAEAAAYKELDWLKT